MERHTEEPDIAEPLISNSESENEGQDGRLPDDHHDQLSGQQNPVPINLRNAGKFVWILTLSAGISGLLFGYDTGVVSSALVTIGSDLDNHPLTTEQKSFITAVTSLFALLFAPITGYLADRFGRRTVILIANVLFILGAVIQASAYYVALMIVGRATVGAAIGLASCATPLYITELAPAEIRGRLVTIQSLFITGGQVVAYFLGWVLASFPGGWRWMVGLGALPAIVQALLLSLMFETPRWLIKAGHRERARAVLRKVYSGLVDRERTVAVDHTFLSIELELKQEDNLGSRTDSSYEMSTNDSTFFDTARQLIFIPGNRRALTIACMLQGLQQLCGFNSLMYFSATIFALVGFTSPIGTSLSIALTNFVFTIAAFHYIDTVGRRKILLRSIPFMAIGLLACSLSFQYIPGFRSDEDKAGDPNASVWPTILVISMIFYVAAYAIGLGCVPWQQSELFPLRVRSLGSGLATATNWTSNFVIGSTFLPMMEYFGSSSTFMLYACICVLGWICIWCIYPETAGLQLEGIGELLKNDWGVKESVERFRVKQKVSADEAPSIR